MKTPGTEEPKILTFKTSNAFEKWLAKNHHKVTVIWLRFFKKDSGKAGITYKEAVDEALCYGWIDGQANKYDDESWIQKFTPRSAKSIWSKKNTDNIERLTAQGRMKSPGLEQVDKAMQGDSAKTRNLSMKLLPLRKHFYYHLNSLFFCLRFFGSLKAPSNGIFICLVQCFIKDAGFFIF